MEEEQRERGERGGIECVGELEKRRDTMAIACGKLNSDGLCRIYYIQERIKSERQEKFGLCGHLSL